MDGRKNENSARLKSQGFEDWEITKNPPPHPLEETKDSFPSFFPNPFSLSLAFLFLPLLHCTKRASNHNV